jgi:hypothetical protein
MRASKNVRSSRNGTKAKKGKVNKKMILLRSPVVKKLKWSSIPKRCKT